MKNKVLLYEDFGIGASSIVFKTEQSLITEAMKDKNGRLKVVLPVGYVDKPTGNKRTYERKEVEASFKIVKPLMESGAMHGAHGKHPDTFYVNPDEVSHLIKDAWVDKEGFIFNEWLVLNTTKGRDLAEMFLSGASIGCSIRGKGVEVKEANNNFIRGYEFGGTDTVGLPSTGVYAGANVPKVEISLVESQDERILIESLENRDDVQHFNGDVKKLELQLESLTTEKEALTQDLEKQRTQFADLKVENDRLITLYTQYKEYALAVEQVATGLRDYAITLESVIEEYTERTKLTDFVIEDLRDRILVITDGLGDDSAASELLLQVVEELRTNCIEARNNMSTELASKYEAAVKIIETMKEEFKKKETEAKELPEKLRNNAGFLIRKHPALMAFKEELLQVKSVDECRNRAVKYLKVITNSNITLESMLDGLDTREIMKENKPAPVEGKRYSNSPIKGWN